MIRNNYTKHNVIYSKLTDRGYNLNYEDMKLKHSYNIYFCITIFSNFI